MGDKSPKSKRKSETQKQAKADATEQTRRKAADERNEAMGKTPPPNKAPKRR